MTDNPTDPHKRTRNAVILSILMSGVGQIYLGPLTRGVIILIAGLSLYVFLTWFLGWWGILPFLAFWIWQSYDAYKIGRSEERPTASQNNKSDFGKGWGS